jgi:hypothetical protein
MTRAPWLPAWLWHEVSGSRARPWMEEEVAQTRLEWRANAGQTGFPSCENLAFPAARGCLFVGAQGGRQRTDAWTAGVEGCLADGAQGAGADSAEGSGPRHAGA